jgi:hypothetical protein
MFNYIIIILLFNFVLNNGQNFFNGCGIRSPLQLPQLCPSPIVLNLFIY